MQKRNLSNLEVSAIGLGCMSMSFSCDPPKASTCGSANGKVKRRRRDGGNGAAAERPSRNRRRKHADHSALRMPLVTSALFCGMEPARL
jgi:hypothetical protein